jgi:hypothetical protein
MGKQNLRISGHADSVIAQPMQNQRRIPIRSRRSKQPSPNNNLIGGRNRNILQIRVSRAQHLLEKSHLLGSQSAPTGMQTPIRQVDTTNSAKHEIKNDDDEQKAKSSRATHAAICYELRSHHVPEIPFVPPRVLSGLLMAVKTKMALAPKAAPFSISIFRIAN